MNGSRVLEKTGASPRMVVAALCAGLSLACAVSAHADTLTLIEFKGSGMETVVPPTSSVPPPAPAVNTWGGPTSVGNYRVPGDSSDSTTFKWLSHTATVDSAASASAANAHMKTRAQLEGALVPVNNPPTCHPGDRDCVDPDGYNWNSFTFDSHAQAQFWDTLTVTHGSRTPFSYRVLYNVDGTNTTFADHLPTKDSGGGYLIDYYSIETYFAYGDGTGFFTDLYTYSLNESPEDLNPQVPRTATPENMSVYTPIRSVSTGLDLWLDTRVRIGLTNLDSGNVLFDLESDYSNTVTLQGVEVYDEFGNLIPDAIVTGANGYSYKVLGAPQPVPEPATLLLLGIGLVGGIRARSRRT